MRDPRKWPKVMFIGGEMSWRKIEYREYDIFREVRSMNDVPPGSDYTLCYGKGNRGPVYTWSRSTLVERSWRGEGKLRPATYLYIYYPSGELMKFQYRSYGYNRPTDLRKPSNCLEETFARNGTLLGCGYVSRCGSDKQAFIGYWLGEEVTYRELQERAFQLQRSAFGRPSKAKRP